MSIPMKLLPTALLIASLAACASAGSGPRTLQDRRADKVEIRIENRNWSTARVYVAASGGRPYRIATVSGGRTETEYVRISSTYFVLVVTFLADNDTWSDFTEWSSEEECLHITIMNTVFLTNVAPCRSVAPWRYHTES